MSTPAPVEIARKVLEGVECFGAETILARAVIELSAENERQTALLVRAMPAMYWHARENHGKPIAEMCDRWLLDANAALSPTEGDGRKENNG